MKLKIIISEYCITNPA